MHVVTCLKEVRDRIKCIVGRLAQGYRDKAVVALQNALAPSENDLSRACD